MQKEIGQLFDKFDKLENSNCEIMEAVYKAKSKEDQNDVSFEIRRSLE